MDHQANLLSIVERQSSSTRTGEGKGEGKQPEAQGERRDTHLMYAGLTSDGLSQ